MQVEARVRPGQTALALQTVVIRPVERKGKKSLTTSQKLSELQTLKTVRDISEAQNAFHSIKNQEMEMQK